MAKKLVIVDEDIDRAKNLFDILPKSEVLNFLNKYGTPLVNYPTIIIETDFYHMYEYDRDTMMYKYTKNTELKSTNFSIVYTVNENMTIVIQYIRKQEKGDVKTGDVFLNDKKLFTIDFQLVSYVNRNLIFIENKEGKSVMYIYKVNQNTKEIKRTYQVNCPPGVTIKSIHSCEPDKVIFYSIVIKDGVSMNQIHIMRYDNSKDSYCNVVKNDVKGPVIFILQVSYSEIDVFTKQEYGILITRYSLYSKKTKRVEFAPEVKRKSKEDPEDKNEQRLDVKSDSIYKLCSNRFIIRKDSEIVSRKLEIYGQSKEADPLYSLFQSIDVHENFDRIVVQVNYFFVLVNNNRNQYEIWLSTGEGYQKLDFKSVSGTKSIHFTYSNKEIDRNCEICEKYMSLSKELIRIIVRFL